MFLAHLGADADAVPLLVMPVVALVALHRDRGRRNLLLTVAVGALAFQVAHALEHALQVGYWLAHPADPAWLTPWATSGRDLLAAASDGRAATGAELLHLIGNAIFLAGLVALPRATRGVSGIVGRRLRAATVLQTAHVIEHVALTVSTLLGAGALGVTTLFGALPAGEPVAVAVRVWSHFGINAAATAGAVAAVWPIRSALTGRRGPSPVAVEPG